MLLTEWLDKSGTSVRQFCKQIGIQASTMYRHLSERSKFTPKWALLIEAYTKGEVSRTEALWPEDYVLRSDEGIQRLKEPRMHRYKDLKKTKHTREKQ